MSLLIFKPDLKINPHPLTNVKNAKFAVLQLKTGMDRN